MRAAVLPRPERISRRANRRAADICLAALAATNREPPERVTANPAKAGIHHGLANDENRRGRGKWRAGRPDCRAGQGRAAPCGSDPDAAGLALLLALAVLRVPSVPVALEAGEEFPVVPPGLVTLERRGNHVPRTVGEIVAREETGKLPGQLGPCVILERVIAAFPGGDDMVVEASRSGKFGLP